MRLARQFQGQTVKGQGQRRAGAYRVGRTRRPHCLFEQISLPCYWDAIAVLFFALTVLMCDETVILFNAFVLFIHIFTFIYSILCHALFLLFFFSSSTVCLSVSSYVYLQLLYWKVWLVFPVMVVFLQNHLLCVKSAVTFCWFRRHIALQCKVVAYMFYWPYVFLFKRLTLL